MPLILGHCLPTVRFCVPEPREKWTTNPSLVMPFRAEEGAAIRVVGWVPLSAESLVRLLC